MATCAAQSAYLCFLLAVLLGISLSSSSRVVKNSAEVTHQAGLHPQQPTTNSEDDENLGKLEIGQGIGIDKGLKIGSGIGLGVGEGFGSAGGLGLGIGFGQGSGGGGSGLAQGVGYGSGGGGGGGLGQGVGYGSGGGGGSGLGEGIGGDPGCPTECFECRQSLSGICCPYEEVVGEACPPQCFECAHSVSGRCCPFEVTTQLHHRPISHAAQKTVVDASAPLATLH
uniref:Uncharacterized protein n=1 Tax=Kalanchoe fedtschenkoi TaxID=63787 RepID=A0A7N0UP20_KALFE